MEIGGNLGWGECQDLNTVLPGLFFFFFLMQSVRLAAERKDRY